MNEPADEAFAWLALLLEGRVSESPGTATVCELTRAAGWTSTATRRGEHVLVEGHRREIEDRLDRLWPGWRDDAAALREAGLKPSKTGWRSLRDIGRRAALPSGLPPTLNRRTAAAAVREHSKVQLNALDTDALANTTVTHDNLLRIRPHPGMTLENGGESVEAEVLVRLCGEVCVTERAFRSGTVIGGATPAAILLVENLGVYVDTPLPSGWCAVHVPGWNTRMVDRLRGAWPGVPALLFGDLDPNGVAIARSLRAAWPDLIWFIPEFVDEYLPRSRPGEWPEIGGELPPIVRRLIDSKRWLEQEVFVLDGRLAGVLASATPRVAPPSALIARLGYS